MLYLKRGDTLSVSGFLPVTFPQGLWSAIAQIVDPAGVAHALICTITPPSGTVTRYRIELYLGATASSALPLGKYKGEIQFTDASGSPEPFRMSTADFPMIVGKDLVV